MNPHRRNVFALLAVAFLLARAPALSGEGEPSVGTAAGQVHPDFLLPGVDGGFIRLSDYRGKKVFLFHFASW